VSRRSVKPSPSGKHRRCNSCRAHIFYLTVYLKASETPPSPTTGTQHLFPNRRRGN
jgi:hypothetical protein